MSFKHLEDGLPAGQVEPYLDLFGKLQEPTKTVFGYTLDLASFLKKEGLTNHYLVFGGYSVLSHLMTSNGPEIARTWRGSSDIDMAGDGAVLLALRRDYDMHSDLASPNINDKRTLKLTTNGEEECKIDFSQGAFRKKYGAAEVNEHFGVPLSVLCPRDIIKGKLYTPIGEEQHIGDILGMLSVLERRGVKPEEIVSLFSGVERSEFYKRLVHGNCLFEKDRFGIFPTRNFFRKVLDRLSKRALVAA